MTVLWHTLFVMNDQTGNGHTLNPSILRALSQDPFKKSLLLSNSSGLLHLQPVCKTFVTIADG